MSQPPTLTLVAALEDQRRRLRTAAARYVALAMVVSPDNHRAAMIDRAAELKTRERTIPELDGG